MKMPRFSAEATLYKTSGHYLNRSTYVYLERSNVNAQFLNKLFRRVSRVTRRAAPVIGRVARVAAPIAGRGFSRRFFGESLAGCCCPACYDWCDCCCAISGFILKRPGTQSSRRLF
jgi:hypothetical protein